MVSSSLPKRVHGTGGSSNLTSQTHAGANQLRAMTFSRKSHIAAVTAGSMSNSSWNSASYFESLNVLSDDTMSQACSLLLQGGDCNQELLNSTSLRIMNDSKESATNAIVEKDQQEDQKSDLAIPIPIAEDTTILNSTTSIEYSDTRQKELEQLQQLFHRCCQAAVTYERESETLLQKYQVASLQTGMTVPNSSVANPGTMARTKISAAPTLGNSVVSTHRTSLIRNGSGRAPLGGGSITLPNMASSSKGSIGAAISTCGISRRRPLEREKSDSSSATTQSSSKAAISSTANYQKKTMSGKNDTTVVPPPPPSALQFLAMLNNDATTSNRTESTKQKRNAVSQSLEASLPFPMSKKVKISPPKVAPTDLTPESPPVRVQPPRASRK